MSTPERPALNDWPSKKPPSQTPPNVSHACAHLPTDSATAGLSLQAGRNQLCPVQARTAGGEALRERMGLGLQLLRGDHLPDQAHLVAALRSEGLPCRTVRADRGSALLETTATAKPYTT